MGGFSTYVGTRYLTPSLSHQCLVTLGAATAGRARADEITVEFMVDLSPDRFVALFPLTRWHGASKACFSSSSTSATAVSSQYIFLPGTFHDFIYREVQETCSNPLIRPKTSPSTFTSSLDVCL